MHVMALSSKFEVTLRQAVYRPSFRFGAKLVEAHDQIFYSPN
jgi:hypothetical protein